jgi:hypothetical protein
MALRERPQSLRLIANRLIDAAETGDLPSICELVDRLDGRPVQMIDRHDVVVTELTDAELYVIVAGRRCVDELEMKVIPPVSLKDCA